MAERENIVKKGIKTINAKQEMYIETNVVFFADKETGLPYSHTKFKFISFGFTDFHLGAVFELNRNQGLYFAKENTKYIDNKLYDWINQKERFMINAEVESYEKAKIKLPTIYLSLDKVFKLDCVVTITNSGYGTIIFIKEQVEEKINFDKNGFYSAYDYYKISERLIEEKKIYYLFEEFINKNFDNIVIKECRPFIKTVLLKSDDFKEKILLVDALKETRLVSNDYTENKYIDNRFYNLSVEKWNHAYFDGNSFVFIYEDFYNPESFINYFCTINYYLLEKAKLISQIQKINSASDFNEELFIECINNKKLMDNYNFAWSINPKIVSKVKELMCVDKLYDELLKIYEYHKIKNEIIDRKNEQKRQKDEIRKEYNLSLISAMASCFAIVELIEILYNLEVTPVFYFSKNLAKLIAIFIVIIIFLLMFFKNNYKNNNQKNKS